MENEDMFGPAESVTEEVLPVEAVETQVEAPAPAPVETSEPANPLVPPVVDAKPDPGFVPISVVLDERDKRKALEEQLRNLQPQAQQPPVPDVFDDPQGFAAHQMSLAQQHAMNVKLDLSEESARDKFGDDVVDKAREWALSQYASRPGFQQQVLGQRNPYRYVVEQYQREQIASQVSLDDFQQFQAWKAAQTQLSAQQQAAPLAAPSQSAAPPMSIVSAPSAGSTSAPKPDPVAEKVSSMFGA